MKKLLNVGNLSERPDLLYQLCLTLDPLEFGFYAYNFPSEAMDTLLLLCDSLWAALPPVVTIDFRSPGEDSQGDME